MPCLKCGECCNAHLAGTGQNQKPDGSCDVIELHKTEDGFCCGAFDVVTSLCKIYETRPWICREFPFYGKDKISPEVLKILPPNCGFRDEVNF